MSIIQYLIAALLLTASSVWAGDLEEADTAWLAKDYATALNKYKMAAKNGTSNEIGRAQHGIGSMYYQGEGVTQDYFQAFLWYKLAAARRYSYSQNSLALMYAFGEGTVQDYVRAHMWSNLSATSGDALNVKNRNFIASKMTHQQITESQKLARECLARNFKNCD